MATVLAAQKKNEAKLKAKEKGKRKAEGDLEDVVVGGGTAPLKKNKQRVLLLSSRGITFRMRHLMNDLEALMPHAKKDSKLDSKSNLLMLNELAELYNCNNTLYFEARRHQDLYMWMSKTPNGPSVKMHVQNIHTMDELKMTGNCLKGSRPLLSFDKTFDGQPHLRLMKELLSHIFGVPKSARRSKPFVDHVLSFSWVDNKIWFRNFQIIEKDTHAGFTDVDGEDEDGEGKTKEKGKGKKKGRDKPTPKTTLTEIGPRLVLTPIKIFEGSFNGAVVFENSEYVSPNAIRHQQRLAKGTKFGERKAAEEERKRKMEAVRLPEDELADRNVFA